MNTNPNNQGLIHIYYGDGKGKTTASIGLSIRMIGKGGKVAFIQFLKGRKTSELSPLEQLGVEIHRTHDVKKFVKNMSTNELEICKKDINKCYNIFKECLSSGKYSLVVADEILHCINYNFIPLDDMILSLKNKDLYTEVVLTGRNPSDKLCEHADYITHMSAQKHPYSKGISAREGIEY